MMINSAPSPTSYTDYNIGDVIYYETISSTPYKIGKIIDVIKHERDTVPGPLQNKSEGYEIKVEKFWRKCDLDRFVSEAEAKVDAIRKARYDAQVLKREKRTKAERREKVRLDRAARNMKLSQASKDGDSKSVNPPPSENTDAKVETTSVDKETNNMTVEAKPAKVEIVTRCEDVDNLTEINYPTSWKCEDVLLSPLYKKIKYMSYRLLYGSKIYDYVAIDKIRGKITLKFYSTLYTEKEILETSNFFMYHATFDKAGYEINPKKKVSIGIKYQVDNLPEASNILQPNSIIRDTDVWCLKNYLKDEDIDTFLVSAKCIGTYLRSKTKEEKVVYGGIHSSVYFSSRDTLTMFAYNTLHESNYDVCVGMKKLCEWNTQKDADPLESFSNLDYSNLIVGLGNFGKNFLQIQREYFPHKSVANVVNFYYMYKTTDIYHEGVRKKDKKNYDIDKTFSVKDFDGTSSSIIIPKFDSHKDVKCANCNLTSSSCWYLWSSQTRKYRLCTPCWVYWKCYAGLTKIDTSLHVNTTWLNKVSDITQHKYMCRQLYCPEEFSSQILLSDHMQHQHKYTDSLLALKKRICPTLFYKSRCSFYMRPYKWIRVVRSLLRPTLRSAARSKHAQDVGPDRMRSIYNSVNFTNPGLVEKFNFIESEENGIKRSIKSFLDKFSTFKDDFSITVDEIITQGYNSFVNRDIQSLQCNEEFKKADLADSLKNRYSHNGASFTFVINQHYREMRNSLGKSKARKVSRNPNRDVFQI